MPVLFRHQRARARWFFVLLLAALFVPTLQTAPTRAAGVIYVNAAATGAATGTSWSNAYPTLQSALATATAGTELWVARGVYYPDTGAAQTNNTPQSTFMLAKDIALYGGFVGTETSRTERNVTTNVTVLSGDLEQNDTLKDANGVLTSTTGLTGTNAYHVVTGTPGITNTAILDGFTITAGWGNAPVDGPNRYGGGMYNEGSSPTLTNVTFAANAAVSGGGMLNIRSKPLLTDIRSKPLLTNVTFTANSAKEGVGSGMYNYFSDPTLTNVTFSTNTAKDGGGMFNYYSGPTLTNVTFAGNSATQNGGGMYNSNTSNPMLTNVTFTANTAGSGGGMINIFSNPTLRNVTFAANRATNSGGGMLNMRSSPMLTNVTFAANAAAAYGGGMVNRDTSNPTLTNVTFATNTAIIGGGISNFQDSTPTLTNVIIAYSSNGDDCVGSVNAASAHNLIKDSTNACGLVNGTNGNILGQDPRLGPLQNNGGATLTHALLAGSPAINAGTNISCPATDQRGVARPQDAACDIGAVEYYVHRIYLPLIRHP